MATSTDNALLSVSDLTKTFGNISANDGISFSIAQGEIRGLIGPNGSGKTTFFNTITGYLKADSGNITFDETDITTARPYQIAQQGLVRTFQIVSPFQNMTVRENLLAVNTPNKLPERKKQADTILSFLDIDHIADHKASDMSGGQQKLLELARVLMLDPKCILLDEPCAGVNPKLVDQIIGRINELNERGTSFVIIEHDMEVIEEIADVITVFSQGKNLIEGNFKDIQGDPNVRKAYLGETNKPAKPDKDSSSSTVAPGKMSTESISSGYGAHQVIKDVSVESHSGVTCILGPNGSGKSTLMKVLNGVLPVWSGSVCYDGKEISNKKPENISRSGIVTLPQGGGVFKSMTVEENLRLGGRILDEKRNVNDRIQNVLNEFPPLEEKFEVKAGSLSGGQQMMVSFGRAMMSEADIYLLDEPSAGLSPALVDDVLDLIDILVNTGAEIILIEQNVKAALQIADYVYLLSQGEVQFDGKPEQLQNEDELIDLYLGIG